MGFLNKLKDIANRNKDDESNEGNVQHSENKEYQHKQLGLEIKMPGSDEFVPLGKWQYHRIYKDDIGPRLLCVLDECAELIVPGGIKTQEGKEEDALKQEIVGLIQSITQLGRSSGMHIIIATQRNDAGIIPGVIQNNPLQLNTKLRIRRKVSED